MTFEPLPKHSFGPHKRQNNGRTPSVTRLFTAVFLIVFPALATAESSVKAYDLDQAIAVALENNRLRTISQQSMQIAEEQYQQAKSAYWPSLSLNASFQRRDEKANFEYPAQRFDLMPGMLPPVEVPAQEIDILGRDTTLY
ncbi:MAG: TolC family protein, partial [Candidatus Thiodiazotropha taylori]